MNKGDRLAVDSMTPSATYRRLRLYTNPLGLDLCDEVRCVGVLTPILLHNTMRLPKLGPSPASPVPASPTRICLIWPGRRRGCGMWDRKRANYAGIAHVAGGPGTEPLRHRVSTVTMWR